MSDLEMDLESGPRETAPAWGGSGGDEGGEGERVAIVQTDADASRRRVHNLALSLSDDPIEETVDAHRLNRALSDAVRYAFGVVAGEVWLLRGGGGGGEGGGFASWAAGRSGGGGGTEGCCLVRAGGGYYRRPGTEFARGAAARDALARLEDPTHPRHIPTPTFSPGAGLVGTLFREAPDAVSAKPTVGGGDSDDEEAGLIGAVTMSAAMRSLEQFGERTRSFGAAGEGIGGGGDGDGDGHHGDGDGEPVRSVPSPDPDLAETDDAGLASSPATSQRHRSDQPDTPQQRPLSRRRSSIRATMKQSASMVALSLIGGGGSAKSPPMAMWRDVASLLADPDTAKAGPRLAVMAKAGFGLALGVPFRVHPDGYAGRGQSGGVVEGIAVYYARANADLSRLSSAENLAHLRMSTQVISAVLASIEARRAAAAAGREISAVAFRKFANQVSSSAVQRVDNFREEGGSSRHGVGTSTEAIPEKPSPNRELAPLCAVPLSKAEIYAKKCRGGNLQIPPSPTYRESLFTMLGAFCGLILLSGMDVLAKRYTDDEVFLLIGPFGALMTLQYGLTSAPASQPRNMVMGQVIAGAVSLVFTYIPEEYMSMWVRRAVGPAVAIATMVKLGVPHPPAGAHSVIYSEGKHNWTFYGLVVLGTIFSVVPGILVNNLSPKRQYPIFWTKWLPVVRERLPRMRTGKAKLPSHSESGSQTDRNSKSQRAP